MQVFQTDKKTTQVNRLKRWLLILAIALPGYLLFHFALNISNDTLVTSFLLFSILNIVQTLTSYHVTKVLVDKPGNRLAFVLNSPMLGGKIKNFELGGINSALSRNSWAASLAGSPVILNIFLPGQETFCITGRYGFPKKILTAVNNALENSNNEQVKAC